MPIEETQVKKQSKKEEDSCGCGGGCMCGKEEASAKEEKAESGCGCGGGCGCSG